jgi:fimbrial chaperone protein
MNRVLLAALLTLAGATMASAASFTVNPMSVRLSPRATSQLVTISNESKLELRFEIKAFAWDHDESDAMKLDPTGDVAFFPNVVTLPPGKQQKVRVGTTAAFGATERAYRLFVEELPSAPGAAAANRIAMRTRIGIPVFLEASKPNGHAEISETAASNRSVSAMIRNTGNTHVMVDSIEFRGFNQAGQVVFTRTVPGWYVLAGRTRRFAAPVSPEECQSVQRVDAKAVVNGSPLNARADVAPAACSSSDR